MKLSSSFFVCKSRAESFWRFYQKSKNGWKVETVYDLCLQQRFPLNWVNFFFLSLGQFIAVCLQTWKRSKESVVSKTRGRGGDRVLLRSIYFLEVKNAFFSWFISAMYFFIRMKCSGAHLSGSLRKIWVTLHAVKTSHYRNKYQYTRRTLRCVTQRFNILKSVMMLFLN